MSAHYAVRLCSFSSFDGLLAKRHHTDATRVLAVIRRYGIRRASTFEMTGDLFDALQELARRRAIKLTGGSYPWHTWEILDVGARGP